jgi:hypothetical protein
MLPIWQKEFGLGYAELGLLRTLFSGTMADFQIPSGLIAERLGAAPVLALGTALAGTGYCLAGTSAGFGCWWWRCSLAASARASSIRSAPR